MGLLLSNRVNDEALVSVLDNAGDKLGYVNQFLKLPVITLPNFHNLR